MCWSLLRKGAKRTCSHGVRAVTQISARLVIPVLFLFVFSNVDCPENRMGWTHYPVS